VCFCAGGDENDAGLVELKTINQPTHPQNEVFCFGIVKWFFCPFLIVDGRRKMFSGFLWGHFECSF
jgi:hypothetical protein